MKRSLTVCVLIALFALFVASPGMCTEKSVKRAEIALGYISGGLGVWGIGMFCATGGGYELITGTLFLCFSYLCLSDAVEEAPNVKVSYVPGAGVTFVDAGTSMRIDVQKI